MGTPPIGKKYARNMKNVKEIWRHRKIPSSSPHIQERNLQEIWKNKEIWRKNDKIWRKYEEIWKKNAEKYEGNNIEKIWERGKNSELSLLYIGKKYADTGLREYFNLFSLS